MTLFFFLIVLNTVRGSWLMGEMWWVSVCLFKSLLVAPASNSDGRKTDEAAVIAEARHNLVTLKLHNNINIKQHIQALLVLSHSTFGCFADILTLCLTRIRMPGSYSRLVESAEHLHGRRDDHEGAWTDRDYSYTVFYGGPQIAMIAVAVILVLICALLTGLTLAVCGLDMNYLQLRSVAGTRQER